MKLDESDLAEQIIDFFNKLPFNKFMGISLIRIGKGSAEMMVDYNNNLIGGTINSSKPI